MDPFSLIFIATWGYVFGTGLKQTASSAISLKTDSLLKEGEKIVINQLTILSRKATLVGAVTVGSVVITGGVTVYYLKRRADKRANELEKKTDELKQRIDELENIIKGFQSRSEEKQTKEQLINSPTSEQQAQIQVPPKE